MFVRVIVFSFLILKLTNLAHGLFGIPKICFCRCGLVKNKDFPYRYPWLAIIDTGSEYIEGALVSDQHVITVASRLYGVPFTNLTITLGAYDRCGGASGLNSSASAIAINPGYSPTNLAGDLALVKLRYPVPLNDFISPICMPYLGLHETGKVGWTSSYQLNSENSTCVPRVTTFPFLSSMTCLGSGALADRYTADKGCFQPLGSASNVCDLDVGAPIMWRWTDHFPFRLMGVVSTAPSCEENVTPLYTRVLEHISWIYDNIQSDCNCI